MKQRRNVFTEDQKQALQKLKHTRILKTVADLMWGDGEHWLAIEKHHMK